MVYTMWGLPRWLGTKLSTCNAGDAGSIPGSGRSLGEGHGNPLQYSRLGNPMNRGDWWATVHGVAKSWTRLSEQTITYTTRQPEIRIQHKPTTYVALKAAPTEIKKELQPILQSIVYIIKFIHTNKYVSGTNIHLKKCWMHYNGDLWRGWGQKGQKEWNKRVLEWPDDDGDEPLKAKNDGMYHLSAPEWGVVGRQGLMMSSEVTGVLEVNEIPKSRPTHPEG